MLLICDETTSHAGRIAWLRSPTNQPMTLSRQCVGCLSDIARVGVGVCCPNCDTIRHRVKNINKNLLERAASFYSPIFPPLSTLRRNHSSIAFRALTCGFFLVSAFTGIAVGVFARFHYVTLFLVTRQPQHPRAR